MMPKREQALHDKIVQAIKTVYDPELPIDVYELGLIYNIDADADSGQVKVLMTLTTPNCPAADLIPANVQKAIENIPEVSAVDIELTFDPPYNIKRLSEHARLALDL